MMMLKVAVVPGKETIKPTILIIMMIMILLMMMLVTVIPNNEDNNNGNDENHYNYDNDEYVKDKKDHKHYPIISIALVFFYS